ncbi:hypothetical protein OO012_07425 [Rhodobacteraceae bacterium KMM 6894]|nr:hypothetical protein [Rhodobacteraceae bacterium KMM 6894]
MRQFLIRSLGSFLIACFVLATSASGYFQAAHEIARAGQTTIVICGQGGTAEVTFDRNGVPVAPEGRDCAHCADCSLISGFDLPSTATFPRADAQPQQSAMTITETILISRPAIKMPRAPPQQGHFLI